MKKPIPFGKYYLLERVNVGGMAEVFKAKAFGVEGFERLLAVKRILPNIAEDKEFIAMFIDEAKIAVQLNHANICQIFDLGNHDGSYFIALEYVHGKDLRAIYDRCKQQPVGGSITMPIAQACFVIMKVCEGLDYAHNKRDVAGHELHLVHRDVSPQNVLISYEGEVKIIDFGIAKAAGKASKTQAGILKGKFGYMSPEQVRGLPLDRRSDIFSVGICLYELLTGERLFVGESDFSTLEKVRNVEILPPSTYNRRIPDELERIVLKALAKDVEDRYQNGIDLHDDLQAFMYSAGEFYSRKDLAAWMKRTYAGEIELENVKLEAHRQFTPPPGAVSPTPGVGGRTLPPPPPAAALNLMGGGVASSSPPPFATPPLPRANGKPTVRGIPSGAAVATAAMASEDLAESDLDWDDEERETHVYDSPTDATDAIEAELPVSGRDLLDDIELSSDGAPVPAKAPPAPARPSGSMGVPNATPLAVPALSRPTSPGLGASAPPPSLFAHEDPTPLPPPRSLEETRPGSMPLMDFELPSASAPASILRRPTAALPASDRKSIPVWMFGAGALVLLAVTLGVYFGVIAPARPGELQVSTDPSDGVRLLIDARPAHLDAAGHIKLPSGVYTLTVEKDGYTPWHDKLELKAGELIKRRVDLEPLPKAGFTLISDPPGAQVLLDGKELSGLTPFKVEGLMPGTHQLEVRVAGRVWTQSVTLDPGKIAEVKAVVVPAVAETPPSQHTIEPLPVPPPSRLPPAPREPTGRTPVATREPVTREPAAREPDVEPPARETPTPRRNLPTPPPVEKEPAARETPAPRETPPKPEKPATASGAGDGFLRINSKPWAKIIVDGNDTGMNTPQSALKLSAGIHRITLTNPSFNLKQSFTVDIKPGASVTEIRDLRPKTPSNDETE